LDLAARIDIVDPLTVDITVRDDAKFSDGTPVMAEDVAWTYGSVLADDSTSLHHKGFVERYRSVVARGPKVVRFSLQQPLATLWSDLDFAILAKRNQRGAGPYVLRELTSIRALLDVNPHYYGTKPKLPHVEIKFVRDASARLLMLVGGSADLIQNSVRLDLIEEVQGRPRIHIEAAPSVILTYLMINNADPVLVDHRVRQAIAYAIDRQAIVAAKFGGRAQLASGLLPAFHWAYAPGLPRWERDLPRAKQLLDAAGLRDPDGDGPRPRLSLVYKTSSDAFRVTLARVIAAQLADVGIDVEVRSFEFATFFADVKKGSYQLASMQTAELNEPDYYYFYFHSSRIPDVKNPDGGNRWRYANPALDKLTEQGRSELDRVKRKAIYAEAQHVVARDLPIIPLWHEDNVALTNKTVQGYTITPNARYIGLINVFKE
ncbi:MAG: ABC transporter substrate-binding protein, partial [Deltaproteobacteria bacterium]|nr:ABC transporter substrate-binding protein [Deltaproteobacteria bacterium]